MKMILSQQAQELLALLQVHTEETFENDFDISELENVTIFWEDRKPKTRGGRSAIEFLQRVYGDY